MQISIYHVDAFTDKIFHGNPAAVCVLPKWLRDDSLYAISKENNLPVTAFLLRRENVFEIRWITPEYELDLCGHGSIAAAFIIFNYLEPTLQKVDLQSRNELLSIRCENDVIIMNFPAKNIETMSAAILEEGFGLMPKEVYQCKNDRILAVYNSEEEIKNLTPNMEILKKLEHRGITITARGKHVDFVSRTFYPKKNISEDPATGASHCLLAPYWSKILNKKDLHALQLSLRGGEIFCRYENDRVFIKGKVVLYSQGLITMSTY